MLNLHLTAGSSTGSNTALHGGIHKLQLNDNASLFGFVLSLLIICQRLTIRECLQTVSPQRCSWSCPSGRSRMCRWRWSKRRVPRSHLSDRAEARPLASPHTPALGKRRGKQTLFFTVGGCDDPNSSITHPKCTCF